MGGFKVSEIIVIVIALAIPIGMFTALLILLVVILVTPALRTRARKQRDDVASTAHEAVVSRLEDHRRKRSQNGDEGAEG